MISCTDIQVMYNRLYKEVRRYIWSFQAVEALADLEIACYEACPDIHKIRAVFSRFKQYALEVLYEDEDMLEVFDRFEELINSEDTCYTPLEKVEEVNVI